MRFTNRQFRRAQGGVNQPQVVVLEGAPIRELIGRGAISIEIAMQTDVATETACARLQRRIGTLAAYTFDTEGTRTP